MLCKTKHNNNKRTIITSGFLFFLHDPYKWAEYIIKYQAYVCSLKQCFYVIKFIHVDWETMMKILIFMTDRHCILYMS